MSVKCSKCGWPIMSGEYRRRPKGTQDWEHMPGQCMNPPITDDEIPPYRELTDAEEQAEEATWD